jgi:hypothetical protein
MAASPEAKPEFQYTASPEEMAIEDYDDQLPHSPKDPSVSTQPISPTSPTKSLPPGSAAVNISSNPDDVSRLSISFNDITYSVKVKEKKQVVDKYILKGVNGLFKAGTLTVSVFHVLIH